MLGAKTVGAKRNWYQQQSYSDRLALSSIVSASSGDHSMEATSWRPSREPPSSPGRRSSSVTSSLRGLGRATHCQPMADKPKRWRISVRHEVMRCMVFTFHGVRGALSPGHGKIIIFLVFGAPAVPLTWPWKPARQTRRNGLQGHHGAYLL